MKKMSKRNQAIPTDPVAQTVEEEPRSVRLRRYSWILGISLFVIICLVVGLVKTHPPASAPESLAQGERSPDAFIQKFHLVSTVQGQKTWEFFADTARLYQGEKQAYSDNIYAQYYHKDRLVSTLTADKAIVNTDTNATQAEGHVELIVENGSKLETEKLNWDPETDTIHTNERVHIFKGKDEITATGMTADTQLNNVKFTKDVHTQVRDTDELQNFTKPKPF